MTRADKNCGRPFINAVLNEVQRISASGSIALFLRCLLLVHFLMNCSFRRKGLPRNDVYEDENLKIALILLLLIEVVVVHIPKRNDSSCNNNNHNKVLLWSKNSI